MEGKAGNKEPNKTRKVTVRFTPDEYEKIEGQFKNTTSRQISEYIRGVLLNKKMTVCYRNKSLDDFMEELVQLKAELNAIGNNYNQVVRKINACQSASELNLLLPASDIFHQKLTGKIAEIKEHLNGFSDKWLQYSMTEKA